MKRLAVGLLVLCVVFFATFAFADPFLDVVWTVNGLMHQSGDLFLVYDRLNLLMELGAPNNDIVPVNGTLSGADWAFAISGTCYPAIDENLYCRFTAGYWNYYAVFNLVDLGGTIMTWGYPDGTNLYEGTLSFQGVK